LNLFGHNTQAGLLLDLGSGYGWLTRHYLGLGIEAIGLDSRKDIGVTPKSKFIRADGRKLPFKDRQFHTIILNDVLEHVPYEDAPQLLVEARRTVREDGVIYISVANRYEIQEPHLGIPFLTWLPKICWNAACILITGNPYNYYPYTRKELKKLLEATGFRFKDFTWFYAREKLSDPTYVGNSVLRVIVKVIKGLNLVRVAEKVSVIVFICTINKGRTSVSNSGN
jgi:SAM-dependent methyltransferase